MRAFRRPSIALLVLVNLWPTLAFGQATKAGVVSTLQGTVTASRATAPQQPVPLKFKDDVFLQDRIVTGDQSIARILLGGKALVTVRERSALTITETPGRSTVNLENGKIGLAVARERMAPNESVDIRTSNAIAAVRGTVVVAEVSQSTAQVGAGAPRTLSNFYVLRDPTNRGIQVTQLATGATANLLAGQGFSILGAAAGRNVPIPPNVSAGLSTPAGAQHATGSTEATSNVATTQTQQAVVLTEAVLGAPAQLNPPPGIPPLVSFTSMDVKGETEPPAPGEATVEEGAAGSEAIEVVVPPPPPPFIQPDITGAINLNNPPFTGHALSVGPGETLIIPGQLVVVRDASVIANEIIEISGTVISEEPLDRAFVVVDPSTVDAFSFLTLFSPGSLSLRSPLVEATGTAAVPTQLFFSDDIIQVQAGALLESTTHRGLVILSLTTVDGGGNFVQLDGTISLAGGLLASDASTVNLAGAVLSQTGGAFTAGGDVASITGGSHPTSAPGTPALSTSGILVLSGAGTTFATTGSVLSASGSTVAVTGNSVISVSGGSTATIGDHAVSLTNSTLDADTPGATVVAVNNSTLRSCTSAIAGCGSVNSTAALISADPSTVNAQILLSAAGGSTVTWAGQIVDAAATAFNLSDSAVVVSNSTFSSSTTAPAVNLTSGSDMTIGAGSVLTQFGGSFSTGGGLVNLDSSSLNATQVVDVVGGTLNVPGSVLSATSSVVTVTGPAAIALSAGANATIGDHGVSLTSSTLDASGATVISVSNATLTGTSDVALIAADPSTITAQTLLSVAGTGTIALAGPVVDATDVTFNISNNFIAVVSGTLSSTTVDPAVTLLRSDLALPNDFLVNLGGTVSLQGGLASIDNSDVSSTGPFILQTGGSFTSAGAELVKVVNGSTLTLTDEFLAQNGGSFSSSGVLLVLDGTTASIAGTDGVFVTGGGTLNLAGAYKVVNGSLTFTTVGASAVTVDNATLNATSPTTPLVSIASTLTLPGTLLDVRNGGTATLAAGALQASNSTLDFSGGTAQIIHVGGAGTQFTTTGGVPVIDLTAGSLSLGSENVLLIDGGAIATIAGPLFTANETAITGSAALASVQDGTLNANGTSLFSLTNMNNANLPQAVDVGPSGILISAGPVLQATSNTLLGFSGDPVVRVNGGTLNAGGVLSQTGGTTTVSGNLVGLEAGGTLRVSGGQSALTLDGGTLVVGGALIAGDNTGNTFELTGPAVTATNGAVLTVGAISDLGDTDVVVFSGAVPAFQFTNSTFNLGSNGLELDFSPLQTVDGVLFVFTGGTLNLGSSQLLVLGGVTTTTTSPVVQILAGATVLGSETLITRFDLTGNPTTVNGTLLLVSDSTVSNLFTLVDFENGLLTTSASTATTPLVILNNSDVTTSGPTVGLFGGNVQIQGTLLEATNTVITTPSAVLFVGFSSVLDDIAAAPSATPLVLITDSSISAGSVVEVDGSGSAINLQRPLLVVDPSTIDTGSLLLITNLGAVTSTATSSFVQLSDVTVTATQDLVAILNGGSLASTSTASLFTTSNSIFNVGGADANGPGGIPSLRFFDISGNSGLTGSSATVSGPLITSSGDTFNVSGAFLRVAGPLFAPATLTHNNPGDANPFMQFTGSVMTLGNPNAPGTGNVVEVGFSPVSGSGIRYQGSGTFLQADTTGVAAWRADRLLLAQTPTPDGDPTLGLNSSSTSPLFSFTGAPLDPTTLLPGGTHTFNNSLFEIKGFNTTVESVLVEVISSGETVSITRGTDEPLRHLGELFRGSATPVQVGDAGGGAVKLDTALFNATKPIMNLINGSAATVGTGGATQVDLLKLIQNAKLNGALVPADALVKLDASTLSIPNGVLAAVSGGSLMNLTGGTTLLSVNNTSNVTINGSSFNAGALVSVTGNSVFKMTGGSLINFGGTGTNAVTIQTGILSFGACAGCVFQTIAIGGINAPVLLKGGATAANNIRVDPTFNAFPGRTLPGNSLTFNNFGSLFIVDGVNSKVVLNP